MDTGTDTTMCRPPNPHREDTGCESVPLCVVTGIMDDNIATKIRPLYLIGGIGGENDYMTRRDVIE